MASSKPKVALISGITGQDGSYLTELLVSKGYHVHGLLRRSSAFSVGTLAPLLLNPVIKDAVFLHYGDMTDTLGLIQLIGEVKPDEVYNLGAMSHVKVSFDMAEYTANTDGLGSLRLLEALRIAGLAKTARVFQASTSELFGKAFDVPQTEKTPFYPRSPYGVAKLFAYWTIVNYREAYGLYGCNGILYNHESPRRGDTFVTRKITIAVAKISLGLQEELSLGQLDTTRDWGHARDYVEMMWMMLQQDTPDDFIMATGEVHSVREFVEKSFKLVGIDIVWSGAAEKEKEVGVDKNTGKVRVRIDPQFYRPVEVDFVQGNPAKAKKQLGWSARTTFEDLVREMVEADVAQVKEAQIKEAQIKEARLKMEAASAAATAKKE